MTKLQETLSYPLRWLRADRAALYLDMSRSKFLELVDAGKLPLPARLDGIKLWDRADLDAAVEAHKGGDDAVENAPPNSFDAVIQMAKRRPPK